jgi:predicted HTH transcriptional regulator
MAKIGRYHSRAVLMNKERTAATTKTRQSTLSDYTPFELKDLRYHSDNWKIVHQLKKEPGLTASELSKKCDLLSRGMSRRLHFLASNGVVKCVVARKTIRGGDLELWYLNV